MHATGRLPWRLGIRFAPLRSRCSCLELFGFVSHPTFSRSAEAARSRPRACFRCGSRIWLTFLQPAYHCLYILARPVRAFLLIPTHAVLSLFAAELPRVPARERSAIPGHRAPADCVRGGIVSLARRSCIRSDRCPLFLRSCILLLRAEATGLFIVVLASASKREFSGYGAHFPRSHWRGRMRDLRLRAGVVALGAIPIAGWVTAEKCRC